MRKIISLMIATLFVTGCYSYKPIDMDKESFAIGHRYKLYGAERNKIKGKIQAVTDSTITVHQTSGKVSVIKVEKIGNAKKGKFSILKTVGIPLFTFAAVSGLAILSWDGPGIGTINFSQ